MKRFRATIWEAGGVVLHPEYIGPDNTTKNEMIQFWGLNEPDVIKYEIKEEIL